MKTPNLNTINFKPNNFESGKFSVVFFLSGRFIERRFETKTEAENFAKPWIEKYSQPEWNHKSIDEWVSICENPLCLNTRTYEEYK